MHLGYPLVPLALAVQQYMAPRLVMAHGAVTDVFEAFNNVVAGCDQAVDLTRPLLYGVLERAHTGYMYAILRSSWTTWRSKWKERGSIS